MLSPITYAGPFDAVDVPVAGGLVVTFQRGETRDLPAGLVERLLEQADWSDPAGVGEGDPGGAADPGADDPGDAPVDDDNAPADAGEEG